MITVLFSALLGAAVLYGAEPAKDAKVDFVKVIKPLLESSCVKCHGADRWHGDLRMDTKELALASLGDLGRLLVPGKPQKSTLYTTTMLPEDDALVMPPRDRDSLTAEQREQLRLWIEQGAAWPEEITLKRIDKVFFTGIASTFQRSCFGCHSKDKAEGGVRLENRAAVATGGKKGPILVPYEPEKSRLYTSLVSPSVHDKNPPRLLFDQDHADIREWIRQGAVWPDDMEFIGPKPADKPASIKK